MVARAWEIESCSKPWDSPMARSFFLGGWTCAPAVRVRDNTIPNSKGGLMSEWSHKFFADQAVPIYDIVVGTRHYGDGKQARSFAGNSRSVDSENSPERPQARLGHVRAHPADLGRCVAGQPGVALSGVAPAGAPGLDQSGVGDFGVGPEGALLPADRGGAQTTGSGGRPVGAAFGRDRQGARSGVREYGQRRTG